MSVLWQYLPSLINPVALQLGPLTIRWYSVMYMLSIITVYGLFYRHLLKSGQKELASQTSTAFNYAVIGILLGARLGYALFYQPGYFATHPAELFWPFANGHFTGISGLSYHGGVIGFCLGFIFYCLRYKVNMFDYFNGVALYVPVGYFFGRIGNFINLELYGRPTSSPLGMYFPTDPQHFLRYPSQLFEAAGEGIVLFLILFLLSKNSKLCRYIAPAYLIGYSLIRFSLEFFREPDSFQNLVFGLFSYGQILSGLMGLTGIVLLPFFSKSASTRQ